MELWTHERLKAKEWKGQPAKYKQVKYNGHRFTAFMQRDGRLVGFEREVRPDREMTLLHPKIVEYPWWKKLAANLPPLSSVDGELYVPDGNAGDAAHAIAACLPELDFMPFAVPWWSGNDESYRDLAWVRGVVNSAIGLPFVATFAWTPDETYDVLCNGARAAEIEGWVLKQANYEGWYKVKPVKSIDCVVTGFKDGEGKYLGLVGALVVSATIDGETCEVARVSGMTDAQRIEVDEDKDLGRVVEVEYQFVGNRGRLVHPRFARWRDDKPVAECAYNSEDL